MTKTMAFIFIVDFHLRRFINRLGKEIIRKLEWLSDTHANRWRQRGGSSGGELLVLVIASRKFFDFGLLFRCLTFDEQICD